MHRHMTMRDLALFLCRQFRTVQCVQKESSLTADSAASSAPAAQMPKTAFRRTTSVRSVASIFPNASSAEAELSARGVGMKKTQRHQQLTMISCSTTTTCTQSIPSNTIMSVPSEKALADAAPALQATFETSIISDASGGVVGCEPCELRGTFRQPNVSPGAPPSTGRVRSQQRAPRG